MNIKESFDTLVKKLEDKGKSADYAKAIAGKVAKEKGDMPYQQREAEEECPYEKLGRMIEAALEESGSDELRGKNQAGQLRAMMAKDPEGAPTKKSGRNARNGKRLGGHYS